MVIAFIISLLLVISFIAFRTVYFSRTDNITPMYRHIPVEVSAAVKRLSRAIQFKTISRENQKDIDGEEFRRMHSFLEREFPLVHQQMTREVVNDYSLLFYWEGSDDSLKPAMYTCHLDVVPVEPGTEEDWDHPPFQGKVEDGYIYGRGTMDVQSGVMAILEAAEALLQQGYQPERSIYLGFGHDEEIDGLEGARQIGRLLDERNVELEFLLDEGLPVVDKLLPGIERPVALVAVAEKGFLSIELTSESEGGHSSVPQGKTSIAKLSDAVQRLEDNPMPSKLNGLVKSTFESLTTGAPLPLRVLFSNLWLFKGLLHRYLSQIPATDASLRTTTATTIFESGVKDNLIPTIARAVVNFRIHPNDDVEKVVRHVRKVINDPEISIRKIDGYIDPSVVSDIEAQPYRILRASIRQVFPKAIVAPALMVGATDARHYAHLTNNVYRFSPLRADESDLDRVHGTNERLSIDNYAEMIQFYSRIIINAALARPEQTLTANAARKDAVAS